MSMIVGPARKGLTVWLAPSISLVCGVCLVASLHKSAD